MTHEITGQMVNGATGSEVRRAVAGGAASTLGILIVGQAQAGKSVFTTELTRLWDDQFPLAPALPFTNSNGFRGLTFRVLEAAGLPLDAVVEEDRFSDLLEAYQADHDVLEVTAEAYKHPLQPEQLRNPAVNSTVALTAESTARPLVNQAGGDHLRSIIEQPRRHGLFRRPGLVLVDSRNQDEGRAKFEQAGVRKVGTLILTCPETVVVERCSEELSWLEKQRAISELTRRNQLDRKRQRGPMTLPQDLDVCHVVDEVMDHPGGKMRLELLGIAVANAPNQGFEFRTNRLSVEAERQAMAPILKGMLRGVEIAASAGKRKKPSGRPKKSQA